MPFFSPRAAVRQALTAPVERVRSAWRELRDERRIAWLVGLAERCDFTVEDLALNREHLARAAMLRTPVRTVRWYVPAFEHAFYGGIHTILRFASGWRARHGVESRFVVHDAPTASAGDIRARIAAAFPALAGCDVTVLGEGAPAQTMRALPQVDAGIATLWTGAYLLLRDRTVGRKLYFLQDDERLFYPAGTQSALAGATWRFGFPAIVNTPGLREVYARESGAPTIAFVPAVDPAVFHPPARSRPERPFRIFFYARPNTDRNAFEVGLAALARLRRDRGAAVEVVAAGSGVPRAIARRFPEIAFQGLVAYASTGELYRSCPAGLALMMTRHPSYLPFELMACGAVPVVNVNRDNAWLLRHEANAVVCEPTVSALAAGLARLGDQPPFREALADEGVRTVAGHGGDDQVDAAAAFLQQPG